MLPYHLRPPRYGNRAENSRRKNDPASTSGGGPVQNAIEADLVVLRVKFCERLHTRNRQQLHRPQQEQEQQEQQQQQPQQHPPDAMPRSHWELGTAFRIFKEEFASAKTSVVHLLHPPMCDREAYSQLIYSACLELLKQSFAVLDEESRTSVVADQDGAGERVAASSPSSSSSLALPPAIADAAFAIFSLWALFETNPLPREVPSPLQLLPVGLRSLEDPRTLYRRFFSQNVRIDRPHYILLLRLRELALATQASCQETLVERRLWDLDRKGEQSASMHREETEQHQSSPSWECTCGVATDILIVLERLFPILDLCEYTGPVGVEAFAGHGDFPYREDLTTGRKQQLSLVEQETRGPLAFEISHEVSSLIDEYHSSIATIHIPPPSSSFASKRLRDSLRPFLPSMEERRRADMRAIVFPNLDETRSTASGASSDGDDGSFVRKQRNEKDSLQGVDLTAVQIEKNPENLGAAESGSSRYELVLRGIIDGDLRRHVEASLNCLLQRDQPLLLPVVPQPLHASGSESLVSAGTLSTLWDGGGSIGIDRGRTAIRDLLSAAGQSNAKPVQRIHQTVGTLFLTSNQEMISGQSDDESIDSDVTDSSLTHFDGGQEDDHSVATSAALGRQALEILLATVKQGREVGHTSTNSRSKKRKASVTNDIYVPRKKRVATDDASSIGQGEAALSELLGETFSRKKSKIRSSVGLAKPLQSSMVDISTTSSFEQGRRKVGHALLYRGKGSTSTAAHEPDDEDQGSLAGSVGPGRSALKDLLSSFSSNKRSTPGKTRNSTLE